MTTWVNDETGGTSESAAASITSGTIDGTVIGGTTPAAGTFTTISVDAPELGSLTVLNRWETADTSSGDFVFILEDSSVFNGDRDNVFSLGYNLAGAQVREDATEPAWGWSIESHYDSGSADLMEMHFQGVHADGTSFRNWSWTVNRSTKAIQCAYNADKISYLDGTNVNQYITIIATTTAADIGLASGSFLRHAVNNVSWLRQLNNAGNGNIELVRVDTSDRVVLAPAGGITRCGGILQTLIMDSGGAADISFKTNNGQEQFRVANTTTATNYIQVVGANGGQPVVSVQGNDTNITMALSAKGTGGFDFYSEGASFTKQVRILNTAGATRTLNLTGSNAGNPTISTSAGNLAITPAVVVAAASGSAIGVATASTTALGLPAGTTGVSSINIPHGSAPSSPVNGDMWTTTAGLFVRINGSTVGPLS